MKVVIVGEGRRGTDFHGHLLYYSSCKYYFSIGFIFKSLSWGNEDVHKIHWTKWNEVCLDKEVGGFRV